MGYHQYFPTTFPVRRFLERQPSLLANSVSHFAQNRALLRLARTLTDLVRFFFFRAVCAFRQFHFANFGITETRKTLVLNNSEAL